mmetsp:Transcript_29453/g.21907  ORF Transcript_29453/g.21907 Transcript_29453/m.21907 type:complete len:206 (-) Transcript_29453:1640-2257(-)
MVDLCINPGFNEPIDPIDFLNVMPLHKESEFDSVMNWDEYVGRRDSNNLFCSENLYPSMAEERVFLQQAESQVEAEGPGSEEGNEEDDEDEEDEDDDEEEEDDSNNLALEDLQSEEEEQERKLTSMDLDCLTQQEPVPQRKMSYTASPSKHQHQASHREKVQSLQVLIKQRLNALVHQMLNSEEKTAVVKESKVTVYEVVFIQVV